MRDANRSDPDFPSPLFFVQATPDDARTFLDRFWPEARAVSDPQREFYTAFGARRGSLGQLLGPRVWAAGLRALFKGNVIGKPQGDVYVMPLVLLVEDGAVVWEHRFRHAGDHPDFTALPAAAR